jgi:hypothetical protein
VSRVLSLADALGGQLASLGPGVCSLSVSELATWHMVRVGAASSDVLFRLADDLGLDQGRTGRWRRMLSGPSGAIVVTANVHRGGAASGSSAT